jgi:prolyl-tRNA synthetase
MAGLPDAVGEMLDTIQADLLAAATAFRDANIREPQDYEELKEIVADAWAKAYWCGDDACEARIKEDTKATNRNVPLDQGDAGPGVCTICGNTAEKWAYWARAY